MIKYFKFLLYPPGDVSALGGNSGGNSGFSTKNDIAILNEGVDDKPEDIKSTKEEPNEDDETPDEESEDTDEQDDEDEEESEKEDGEDEEEEESEEETKEYSSVPAISDIKKKFPEFFKQFPEVRAAIFRDQKFSEVFATPKEASIAANQAATLIEMETDLMSGNSEKLFAAVKKANTESYSKLVSNLLPTLEKSDKDLYMKLAAVPLKKAIRAAIIEGRRKEDKNLEYGAMHLHKFLFDSDDVNEKAEFEQEIAKKTQAEMDFEKRLAQLDSRDLNTFKTSVDEEYLGKVQAIFDKDIDDSLSAKMRSWMYNDLLKEVNTQLENDQRYMNQMRQLWLQAKNSGNNSVFKAKIVNTALARANQIIPGIKLKLKKEALKSSSNGHVKTKKVFTENSRERPKTQERPDRSKSDLDIIRGL